MTLQTYLVNLTGDWSNRQKAFAVYGIQYFALQKPYSYSYSRAFVYKKDAESLQRRLDKLGVSARVIRG